MDKLHLKPTGLTPEILLDPDQNRYIIQGNSRPEDAREFYIPVIEWLALFRSLLLADGKSRFTDEDPFIIQFYFTYFNSSTVKFLNDIINEIREMKEYGIPVAITWYYDRDDPDIKEAGEDLSLLTGIDFVYLRK